MLPYPRHRFLFDNRQELSLGVCKGKWRNEVYAHAVIKQSHLLLGTWISQQATLYGMKRGETWVRHEDRLHSKNKLKCHLYQPAG